jgi:predicted component of type VI protein secretion system
MAQFQFVMRSGPTPGVTFPLEGDQLVIGRDASNGIAINDAEISRKHSRLTFQGGKYVLEDLGSTNGTFINGQRLAGQVVLKPGDVVSLGEQIVLMYDAIDQDPGATMVSPRHAKLTPPPVRSSAPAPAPTSAPMPAPSYTPAPAYSGAPAKKTNLTPIFIGLGVLLFVCLLCGVVLLIVDADPTGARWCMFPFSIIARMLGASCP